jgi:hypothetical protein
MAFGWPMPYALRLQSCVGIAAMDHPTDAAHPTTKPAILIAGGLWAGAILAVVGAGLVLWSARGAAVFTDVVSAALAWCL